MNILQEVSTSTNIVDAAVRVPRSLDALYAEALTLGRPHLFQTHDGAHYCSIAFRTASGISLEAKCSTTTPCEAVAGAIAKAIDIRGQFK